MIETNEKLIDMLAGGALYSTYAKEKAEKALEKATKKEDAVAAAAAKRAENNDEF
jgi:hypothetical protein